MHIVDSGATRQKGRVRIDPLEADDAMPRWRCRGGAIRRQHEDDNGASGRCCSQACEQCAPPDPADDQLRRRGRSESAERSEHDEASIEQSQLLLRKPQTNRFQPGDQRGGNTQSDQRSADDEACQTVCGTEQGGANRGNEQ